MWFDPCYHRKVTFFRILPACFLVYSLVACGPAQGTQDGHSFHSLHRFGTGPLPRTSERGVLIIGWRSEKHGPWKLRHILIDGKQLGSWPKNSQRPQAIEVTPGEYELVLEAQRGNTKARTAPRKIKITALMMALCPVDVERDDPSPEVQCGHKTLESKAIIQDHSVQNETPQNNNKSENRDLEEPIKIPKQGRIRLGKIVKLPSKGTIPTSNLLKKMRLSKSDFLECYNHQIISGNFARGDMFIELMVWNDGCTAEVTARTKNEGLSDTARCVENIVKGFCFDEPQGGTARFRVPLRLEPAPPEK